MKLALTLPGSSPFPSPEGLKPEFTNVASFISPLLTIAFFIAAFLSFYFLVWGAFAYIMAQGDKEGIAKSKARITYAIIGLFVVMLAFFITKFAAEIFPPTQGGLPF